MSDDYSEQSTPRTDILELYSPQSSSDDEGCELISAELQPLLHTIADAKQTLQQAMSDLQQSFDSKLKYDKSKDNVINTLHQELQTMRLGLHFKILRPIFIDLIAMYDDMEKLMPDQPDGTLRGFQDSIEEILNRNDVEIFCNEGDAFNAQCQRANRTVSTEDPELNRQIAYRLSKGFRYENRILRPELVATYRYKAPSSEPQGDPS